VWPEHGRRPEPPQSGIAESRRHGAAASVPARYPGCMILAVGGGRRPAPAATAGRATASSPVVAASTLAMVGALPRCAGARRC